MHAPNYYQNIIDYHLLSLRDKSIKHYLNRLVHSVSGSFQSSKEDAEPGRMLTGSESAFIQRE